MTVLVSAALVLLGAHLALRTIVALYRIIDLGYAIEKHWPRVLRGILGWGGAIVIIALVLPDPQRAVFWWGVVGFVVFYVGLYAIRYPLLRRRIPRVTARD